METANSLVMRKINTAAIRAESGFCYIATIQDGIESDAEGASSLTLYEDGKPLASPHSLHDDIRTKGSGRYSHWDNVIFFSSSDNTNPRENGRVYSLSIIEDKYDAEITPPFKYNGGNCWVADAGGFGPSDDATGPTRSLLFLFEDGLLLDQPHSPHGNIRLHGKGLYSHWDKKLYFSATDNSDPNVNGRRYAVMFRPDYFLAQKASYAYSIAKKMILWAGGLNAVKGKAVLEVGPGDIGASILLAAMGCKVAVIEKYLPALDRDFYAPFVKALISVLIKNNIQFDPGVLEKIAEGGDPDLDQLKIFRVGMEELPPELAGWADITISNAVFEHLEKPDIAFKNLFTVSKSGSVGLHQVDFRYHSDFFRPLEFLLADDAEFEKMQTYKYVTGNRFRKGMYVRLLKEAGFEEVAFTPDQIINEDYLNEFLPRLRASSSRFRDLEEKDLRILSGHFRLVKI